MSLMAAKMRFRGMVALLTLVTLTVLAAGSEEDAELLLEFKASFDNGNEILYSWVGKEPCRGQGNGSWQGITCTPGGTITRM
jgi:hypothetical protein